VSACGPGRLVGLVGWRFFFPVVFGGEARLFGFFGAALALAAVFCVLGAVFLWVPGTICALGSVAFPSLAALRLIWCVLWS